ncbi:MAG: transposase [Proteobacteria bacterium]|nr:hypothetical protein [Desulfocapsa sp.]MBU3943964.1 transposase [Pseudomonadota bacterium]MBU4028985.1 transposase [Pseudomonadota bacterium]MBU4042459.1 transposase [Pseudomonadota bacterium]MBU4085351.1 transposase [Pseudomonadota bacterium]
MTLEQGYKISDDARKLGVNESVFGRRKHEAGADSGRCVTYL